MGPFSALFGIPVKIASSVWKGAEWVASKIPDVPEIVYESSKKGFNYAFDKILGFVRSSIVATGISSILGGPEGVEHGSANLDTWASKRAESLGKAITPAENAKLFPETRKKLAEALEKNARAMDRTSVWTDQNRKAIEEEAFYTSMQEGIDTNRKDLLDLQLQAEGGTSIRRSKSDEMVEKGVLKELLDVSSKRSSGGLKEYQHLSELAQKTAQYLAEDNTITPHLTHFRLIPHVKREEKESDESYGTRVREAQKKREAFLKHEELVFTFDLQAGNFPKNGDPKEIVRRLMMEEQWKDAFSSVSWNQVGFAMQKNKSKMVVTAFLIQNPDQSVGSEMAPESEAGAYSSDWWYKKIPDEFKKADTHPFRILHQLKEEKNLDGYTLFQVYQIFEMVQDLKKTNLLNPSEGNFDIQISERNPDAIYRHEFLFGAPREIVEIPVTVNGELEKIKLMVGTDMVDMPKSTMIKHKQKEEHKETVGNVMPLSEYLRQIKENAQSGKIRQKWPTSPLTGETPETLDQKKSQREKAEKESEEEQQRRLHSIGITGPSQTP